MSLTGKTKANSYKDVLIVPNSNSGIDATTRNITSGDGSASSLNISDDVLTVTPKTDDTTAVFKVTDKDSNALLNVDSSSDLVRAGIGQHIVNTNIKEFALSSTAAFPDTADTWFGLFSSTNYGTSNILDLGTGSTPAVSYGIPDGSYTAMHVIKNYWYIPFNITIDSANCWFANDTSGGDTVKFSVMSYAVVKGTGLTAGDLSSGIEHLLTSTPVSTVGGNRAYYLELAEGAAGFDVDSGRVILACVAQDGTDADLTVNMQIVYHLR